MSTALLLLLSVSVSPAAPSPFSVADDPWRSVANMDPWPEIAAAAIKPNYQRSVVQILAKHTERDRRGQDKVVTTFYGSGFIIHKKLQENRFLVITCWHVPAALKPDQRLMVRLPGTTEDVVAYAYHFDEAVDLQVISVHVPQHISVGQFPSVVFSPEPAPVGDLVALVGYNNPINFPIYINREREVFLATEPSACGGYIVGPQDHTEDSGTIIQHSCSGIRGSSGGPLVSYGNGRVIGVFTSVTIRIGESVSTECVRVLLGTWLQSNGVAINDNDTIHERIDKCAGLY